MLGAGFSRTGTFSLKRALERLGFGPCYHMDEVFRRPDHIAQWEAAATAEPDWRRLLDGYRSAVDAPVCHFWRQILQAYPRTKVILTVRDADAWYESFRSTVYQTMSDPGLVPLPARGALDMARHVVLDTVFAGRFLDRAYAIGVYREHNRTVADAVDPMDLLVYDVADGWAPLCDFFALPIPSQHFPNTNARSQFRSRVGLE